MTQQQDWSGIAFLHVDRAQERQPQEQVAVGITVVLTLDQYAQLMEMIDAHIRAELDEIGQVLRFDASAEALNVINRIQEKMVSLWDMKDGLRRQRKGVQS